MSLDSQDRERVTEAIRLLGEARIAWDRREDVDAWQAVLEAIDRLEGLLLPEEPPTVGDFVESQEGHERQIIADEEQELDAIGNTDHEDPVFGKDDPYDPEDDLDDVDDTTDEEVERAAREIEVYGTRMRTAPRPAWRAAIHHNDHRTVSYCGHRHRNRGAAIRCGYKTYDNNMNDVVKAERWPADD